jgi:cysteinyl-tRNA synthetase
MAEAHPLMLYNTLTRRKEAFEPLDPGNVRMYVCGPTVYDYAHIGNARPVIVFDVLFRLLRHIYGARHVTYVRNITDVDDKINARAVQEYPDLPLNEAIRKVTMATEKQFHDDIRALGVLTREDVNRPGQPAVFYEPRATEHIAEMRTLIEALVANGHAYVAENHVLFDVPSMLDYGRLSNRSLEEMEAGARVEVAPYKKDPMDFVLWKPSKAGEPSWPSPCGIGAPGRPGWHIECSAMAGALLGDEFDIHGGGIDLVFPHHENEIAQSRCAHGTPVMARYWLHNGFLQVEGEKMSKSLGNFITIHELLNRRMGEVIRYQMLKTHYRQPIDWTEHNSNVTQLELIKFSRMLRSPTWEPRSQHLDEAFVDALYDDLNTPAAIAILHGICDEVGKLSTEESAVGERRLDALHNGLALLGFGEIASFEDRIIRFKKECAGIESNKVESLVAARSYARKAKDFKEADRIRDELAAMGIALKDSKDPKTGEITTTWEVRVTAMTEASR